MDSLQDQATSQKSLPQLPTVTLGERLGTLDYAFQIYVVQVQFSVAATEVSSQQSQLMRSMCRPKDRTSF